MSLYKLFRPIIFKLNPEKAHDLAIDYLRFFRIYPLCLKSRFHNLKLMFAALILLIQLAWLQVLTKMPLFCFSKIWFWIY